MNNLEFAIRCQLTSYVDTCAAYNFFKELDPKFPSRVQDSLEELLLSRFVTAPNIFNDDDIQDENYAELVAALNEHMRRFSEEQTNRLLRTLLMEHRGRKFR